MESVRNWLEQTIGMPIDYICIIIMGMLTLHVLIRIAIHWKSHTNLTHPVKVF